MKLQVSALSPFQLKVQNVLFAQRSNMQLKHGRKSVTLVHKGNIMKFTEGAFKNWGYEVAEQRIRR